MVYLISGIIFIISGLALRCFPPKSINSIIGYRTSMSMKNQETWDEAQKYGGYIMTLFGVINCIVAAFVYIMPRYNNEVFELIFIVVGSIVMIIIGEIHLRKIFNKDGSRK